MLRSFCLFLILLPLASLALVVAQPAPPEATAQNRDDRPRGEADAGPRGNGEGRRGDREGRGRRGNGGRGGRDGGEDRPGGSGGPPSSTTSPRPSASTSGGSLTTEDYVRDLIRKHDKNGDTMLQADEQSGLKGKPAEADQNKDGVITAEEMVATLSTSAPAAAAATGSGGSAAPSGGGGESKNGGERREDKAGATATTRVYTALTGKNAKDATKDAEAKRRTYRFTPAGERLPATGLPSWFKTRDANGDGQVAMSEYSRSWSKRMVDEFGRYDLNGDGVVTAREAAGKQE
jgi:Ca2+-binding EF-hand superfamily protein